MLGLYGSLLDGATGLRILVNRNSGNRLEFNCMYVFFFYLYVHIFLKMWLKYAADFQVQFVPWMYFLVSDPLKNDVLQLHKK